MAYIRTFVAIKLEEPVRRKAGELTRRWSDVGAKVNWVSAANMHLTLKFLGDVEDREVPEVCKTVQQVVADHDPFVVELAGAGAFPATDRPRTLWLGVGEGGDELSELAVALDDALHEIGYAAESRRFHGHLTLGRVRDPQGQQAELQRRVEKASDFSAGMSQVNEVMVFSSVLERDGPQYGVLSTARLGV